MVPPIRASCDCVVEASSSLAPPVEKVVVPIAKLPVKKESLVVVEIRLPTVSCDVVA